MAIPFDLHPDAKARMDQLQQQQAEHQLRQDACSARASLESREPRDNKLPDSDTQSGMNFIVPIAIKFVSFDDAR